MPEFLVSQRPGIVLSEARGAAALAVGNVYKKEVPPCPGGLDQGQCAALGENLSPSVGHSKLCG